jgi:hypothetical protein
MWTATRITADAAEKMQINAGLLLNKFDVKNPTEPEDADIICETTGDFSITCQPETEDFFEDVNNAPKNTMEGKHITAWNHGLSVTAVSVTEETIALALGACDTGTDGGIHPRKQYKTEDFKTLYWIGDMFDETKLLCIVLGNAVSNGGFNFTSGQNAKGNLALELMPHMSAKEQNKLPMDFYILTKAEG